MLGSGSGGGGGSVWINVAVPVSQSRLAEVPKVPAGINKKMPDRPDTLFSRFLDDGLHSVPSND